VNEAFMSFASAAIQHRGAVPRLSTAGRTLLRFGPALCEYSGAVLRELLSRDEAQIAALRAESVI
jgi:hypothetical protein